MTETIATAETIDLFPAALTAPKTADVPLEALPHNIDLIGPDPTAAMIQSVKRLGILTPIIIERWPGDKFVIKAGRRRVKAARRAGLTHIPARIYPAGWAPDGLVSLTDHATRRANSAQEVRDIQALLDTGATETAIAQATGVSVARIRRVMRLQQLTVPMRELLDTGCIAESTALKVAGLPPDVQEALLARYEDQGALTLEDVRDIRTERNRAALGLTLDAAFSAIPTGGESPAPVPPTPAVEPPPALVAGARKEARRLIRELQNALAMAGRADLAAEAGALLPALDMVEPIG